MRIEGICALVTGGARGIGLGLVERLLSKGAKFVAVIDINKETGHEACKGLKGKFGADKVKFIACDVSDENELEKTFEEVFAVNRRLDIVINHAGVVAGPKVIAINLEGVIRGTYLAKKYMSKTNEGSGGVVVNMSSIAGFAPFWDPIYSASKYGVIGFSLTLAEIDPVFKPEDIRVVVICPAAVDTLLLNSTKEIAAAKPLANLVTISEVVDAYIVAIEDDSKHACCIRVTPAFGLDVLPMKSSKEWQTEMKVWKS